MKPLLSVDDVHVTYGSVHAVRGVSLDVADGEVLGIIGANGAGKSSLLNAVMGIVTPSAGRVVVDGKDVTGKPVAEHVRLGLGLSPEGRGILPGLSVRENLELGTYPSRGLRARDRRERLDEAFELFPVLGERANQDAQTLSGGEAAMLSVARALVSKPKVLLLDEPTLGLAPVMSQRLFERIDALKATGLSMVIVEQRATELFQVADRILQVRQGEAEMVDGVSSLDVAALERLYFGEAAS
ncbi:MULTISPECIES: ABC transporter ATP-binding protein [unclassified Nocardioides]|uniref:ABC transporter ATP-binding protein n=1 Tax=unclassified Nocardioides TaxID=2615069 RepID=UPI0009F05876|nr:MULTISPECIES: ABC transporter ATP-binding protein [unclassified Nocardioides]GAW52391.1 High-affinity branched-chain amino acid ABC tran sporter, ATP-binding protein LivF [Nocardioides sp. PD653-B2]GAW53939.1 High-affinity branched-chain amino acid ABC transporter, ATP-binding protein LivF [Nocardioides sp. PD653]